MNDLSAKHSTLYLSPYYWPEEIGTAPYATEFAEYLVEQGRKVKGVTFRPHYPNPDKFKEWEDGSRDYETHNGVDIKRIKANARGNGGFVSRFKNDLRYFFSTIALVFDKDYKSDTIIVYVPSFLAALGGAFLKLFWKSKLVIIVHDIESGLAASLGILKNKFLISTLQFFEKITFNRANNIICLTEGMKKELIKIGCKKPIEVIPIWAEIPEFVPIKEENLNKIMYSGNFGKKQNIDQLIPLIVELDRNYPQIQVIMRGEGSEKERIKKILLEEKRVKNTVFEGLVPKEKLMESLQSVALHLVPQADNVADYALPSKLISIMASGRPFLCIAPENSSLHDLAVSSGGGISYSKENMNNCPHTIQSIVENSSKINQLGQTLTKYANNKFDKKILMRINNYI